MITVAIIGGSGYTGKYILKFCNEHPYIDEFVIYANKSAGLYLHDVFPELVNEVTNTIIKSTSELDFTHDAYFLALPHGESIKYVADLINANKKVIDLGADFRLDSSDSYTKSYDFVHPNPELLNNKCYGLSEHNTDYNYNLVANPGCYPTAALLSCIPLLKNYSELVSCIDTISYSGLSGAGKKVSQSMLFSENYNSVKAYNVGAHRHEVEISQEINKFGNNIDYSLTTHLLPLFSGIYSTTVIHLEKELSQTFLDVLYQSNYGNSNFVRLRNSPPELKWVIGTNYCDINVKSIKNKIIITAAIDNLIKGASGQAMQNMNKLFGWDETLGIKSKKEEFENA